MWLVDIRLSPRHQAVEGGDVSAQNERAVVHSSHYEDEAAGRVPVHRLPVAGGRAQNQFPNIRYSTSTTTTTHCTSVATEIN